MTQKKFLSFPTGDEAMAFQNTGWTLQSVFSRSWGSTPIGKLRNSTWERFFLPCTLSLIISLIINQTVTCDEFKSIRVERHAVFLAGSERKLNVL